MSDKVIDILNQRIQEWSWEPGLTPLATFRPVVACCSLYLAAVWLLKNYIKQPTRLTRLSPALHNVVLCLGSLAMFCGAAWEIAKESYVRRSVDWLVCLPPGTQMKGGVYFWSYIYYLSKYYELLDTFLLILKAKPLSFLHVFHHATVVPMAFFWLADAQSLQQIALLTNTLIHVIMYYYYFLCSIGRGPNWKRLITNAQIVQFMFSFAISVPFWWQHAKGKECSGFRAMVFNAAFNLILLALFIDFHRRTYALKKKQAIRKQH